MVTKQVETEKPCESLGAEEVETLLAGMNIPSPPQVLADLHMELLMPGTDLGDVANIIMKDAGLSGSLLKVANSAFYSRGVEVDSIKSAVFKLGLNTVTCLVNALCLRMESENTLQELPDETIKQLGAIWDSSSDTALAAQVIAREIGYRNADKAYMLGLFHNAGIPLMLTKYPNYADVLGEAYQSQEASISDIENRYFNSNHAVIGYFVAKSWKLPQDLVQLIQMHHRPEQFLGQASKDLAVLYSILKMAEHTVGLHRVLGHTGTDHEWEQHKERILGTFNMSDYDFQDIRDAVLDIGIGGQGYFCD